MSEGDANLKKVISMEFYEAATKVFKLDEGDGEPGKAGHPYRDSKGLWTIGRGHLIGEHLADLRLSENIIEELFKEDLAVAVREARLVVGSVFFESLPLARQIALTSMLYTLGRNKFLKFEETIEAMKREDWDEVAHRVLSAKWARDVDPRQRPGEGRDDRVAYMFKFGSFPSEYKIGE